MRVVCFCGSEFVDDSGWAACPRCGEVAFLPTVTDGDVAEMRAELELLLASHADEAEGAADGSRPTGRPASQATSAGGSCRRRP